MNHSGGPGHPLPTSSTDQLKEEAMSDDDSEVSDGSFDDDDDDLRNSMQAGSSTLNDEITSQLASAGPTGMAAAAAISSTKKRKRLHAFETNPSIRKRQQTRLLRKLRQNIEEYSLRVGQQAVVLVATPGKSQNNFRAFGAKPLEDVIKNLRAVIMAELENALAQQAPPMPAEDPSRHEMPPLVIDGIPTPVEKMTQAQLRAFIPLMLKYSTGRGKPGWGKENTKPSWWPEGVPWANVRMDARKSDDKQKVSWTHALRQIVINCYKFHGREDLLPVFNDDENASGTTADKKHNIASNNAPSTSGTSINTVHTSPSVVGQYTPTVVQTISNPDGTVSIIHVDPSNPVITLPDGTTAQVQGVAQLDPGQQGVHTLAEVAAAQQHTIEMSGTTTPTELHATQEGSHIIITGEDGQAYPVSGMITVPVSAGMYQAVVANMQQAGGQDGTVQIIGAPFQLANGQLVAKMEPEEPLTYQRHHQSSIQGLVTKVMGTQSVHHGQSTEQPRQATLTITPVSGASQNASGPIIQVVGGPRLRQVNTRQQQPDTTDADD